jgi:hypothetical protein
MIRRPPDDSPWPVVAVICGAVAVASLATQATGFFENSTWTGRIEALSSVVVAAFTGALIWYSHRGWQVAKKSADAALQSAEAATKAAHTGEMALKLSERAYVSPLEWTIENLRHGDVPMVSFQIINSGRTRCLLRRLRSGSATGALPPIPFYEGDTDLMNYPLDSERRQKRRIQILGISAGEREDIGLGRRNLWFFYRVDYVDMFGEDHTSAGCMKFEAGNLVVADDAAQYTSST